MNNSVFVLKVGISGMINNEMNKTIKCYISSVQSLGHDWHFVTPWSTALQASLSITNSQSLLKLIFIELVMPSNHLIFCHPLLLSSIFPSIRVFSKALLCMRRLKYWNFSISPFNEYSGLISFRIDWFDLFAFQGMLKSLVQHHSSKASVLWHSAFFYGPTITSVHDYWKKT